LEDKATFLAKELKDLIRKFEHRSFTAHISHMGNIHVRQRSGQIKLRSPIRQLMYLISLYHATDLGGKTMYAPGSEDSKKMIHLLNEIEKGYGYKANRSSRSLPSEDELNKLLITKSTFLNYYLNAPLSYYEQDIERIKRTFKHHEAYILKETGLNIQDYLDFFNLLSELEITRATKYLNHNYDNDPLLQAMKRGKNPKNFTLDEKVRLMDIGEQAVYDMTIPFTDIYARMEEKKAKQLMAYFTLLREEDPSYLYYTDHCQYLDKPILTTDGKHIAMVYSKQLINAIYEFLYQVCSDTEAPGRKVSDRRDLYLEDKTAELFQDFFGTDARIFKSYTLNSGGNEKDLLVICGTNVFIIECKAHKYRMPLRDEEKAYERIDGDFQKSIGKGYDQAKEVEDRFISEDSFEIFDKQKRKIATFDPVDFNEVFTLVVTQERFGQIQCDLSYLLHIEENCNYPWAVAVNDLETFLITLKRKNDAIPQFTEFLLARERLQGRVVCYDELELCAYFLFDKESFIKNCYREEMFISSPDMNLFFDLLYQVGFGFKEETNLIDKVKHKNIKAESVIRYHKLKPAERVADFLKNPKDEEV